MAGKPAEPRPDQQPQRGAPADAHARPRASAEEQIGPLAIERLTKADGRGLILYSQAPPGDA